MANLVPLAHVVGDVDDVVPVAENTRLIERRYGALGGEIKVFHKPTVAHRGPSFARPG